MRQVHMCRCGMTRTARATQWTRLPRTMTLCSWRCWGGCPPAWQARLGASGRGPWMRSPGGRPQGGGAVQPTP
eukprot:10619081-Alexandrium_andersonii.AAC.1